jgi:hypothetical protein
MNHGNYSNGLGDTFQKTVFGNNHPVLMIFKIKSYDDNMKSHTVFVFCNRSK